MARMSSMQRPARAGVPGPGEMTIAAGRAVRLGVELDAEDGTVAVRQRHDGAVLGLGVDLQEVGDGALLDDEGVVARGLHRVGAAGEEVPAAMMDFADFAVHG